MNTLTMKDFYGKHLEYIETARNTAILLASMAVNSSFVHESKIVSRIKTPESMSKKILQDGLPVNYDSILKKESDAIGIRVITDTLIHVYDIVNRLKQMSEDNMNFKIIKIKDFIKKPKESGYRSIHVIISMKSKDPEFPELKAEIQIRTSIMDCWASLEHLMKYKQTIEITPELHEMLEVYAEAAEKEIKSLQA